MQNENIILYGFIVSYLNLLAEVIWHNLTLEQNYKISMQIDPSIKYFHFTFSFSITKIGVRTEALEIDALNRAS